MAATRGTDRARKRGHEGNPALLLEDARCRPRSQRSASSQAVLYGLRQRPHQSQFERRSNHHRSHPPRPTQGDGYFPAEGSGRYLESQILLAETRRKTSIRNRSHQIAKGRHPVHPIWVFGPSGSAKGGDLGRACLPTHRRGFRLRFDGGPSAKWEAARLRGHRVSPCVAGEDVSTLLLTIIMTLMYTPVYQYLFCGQL